MWTRKNKASLNNCTGQKYQITFENKHQNAFVHSISLKCFKDTRARLSVEIQLRNSQAHDKLVAGLKEVYPLTITPVIPHPRKKN